MSYDSDDLIKTKMTHMHVVVNAKCVCLEIYVKKHKQENRVDEGANIN